LNEYWCESYVINIWETSQKIYQAIDPSPTNISVFPSRHQLYKHIIWLYPLLSYFFSKKKKWKKMSSFIIFPMGALTFFTRLIHCIKLMLSLFTSLYCLHRGDTSLAQTRYIISHITKLWGLPQGGFLISEHFKHSKLF
jgi:hypothetical protein